VRRTFERRAGRSVYALTLEDIERLRAAHRKASATAVRKILTDAEKEFDEVATFGYGADGGVEETAADFAAVRGSFCDNAFVKQMQADLTEATET
jgi:hypothetical protein